MPILQDLADRVHEARRRARSIVGTWREQGMPARVVDILLAPYDQWRGDRTPLTRILLETLGENLEPTVERLDTWKDRDLDATLDEGHAALSHRSARRDALMRQGATGTINQVALNAIARFGDVSEKLRRFANEWRFWLPDDMCIRTEDGTVAAANYHEEGFAWDREAVSVSTTVELRRDLATAMGRPVTELIDHPFLSPDMSVLKTEWTLDHTGDRWLKIDLAMPWRLFCSTTGRVWDPAEATGGSGNVVPFARRRA